MTDEDRKAITERLQAAGFTAVQIEKLIPTIAEAIEIAKALGCNPLELITIDYDNQN